MESIIVALILIILLALALLGVLIALIFVKKKGAGGIDSSAIKTEGELIRTDVKTHTDATVKGLYSANDAMMEGMRNTNEQFLQHMKSVAETGDRRSTELKDAIDKGLHTLTERVGAELYKMREDNQVQLDKMRGVVDEKLTKTLDERLSQSFGLITDKLEKVYKNLGEIQQLSDGMTDLRKILSNVKTRGTWAEVTLESLLQEILPGQYEVQCNVAGRGSQERVDFAVVLPGQTDGKVYLPIDVKFPVEDYARLQKASENCNEEEVRVSLKALEDTVRKEARSIRDKYIKPPKTTSFAIMYLPTEGLYAEVLKREKLLQDLYQMNVMPAGPTSVTALLSSLQMGFKSVQIQKESLQVYKAFIEIQKHLTKFNDLLNDARNNLSRAEQKLGKVSDQSQKMSAKLSKIELPSLGVSDAGDEVDTDDMDMD